MTHRGPFQPPTFCDPVDLSSTKAHVSAGWEARWETPSGPSRSSYAAGFALTGSQSLQMLHRCTSILQEGLLSRELMLSSLLFLVEQINIYQHPLSTLAEAEQELQIL